MAHKSIVRTWLQAALHNPLSHGDSLRRDLCIRFILETIWRHRNAIVFNQFRASIETLKMQICSQLRIAIKALKVRNFDQINSHLNPILVRWNPPPLGWAKVNTDGSFSPATLSAACGGVIHDHWGLFLFAFSNFLGNCSIMEAELWGILRGLNTASQIGLKQVIIEDDSVIALQFMEKGCPTSHLAFELVHRILQAAMLFDNLVWSHTFREGNSLANCFSKKGLQMNGIFRSFGSLPDFAIMPFFFYCSGSLIQRDP
ncbi:Ribonuclease H domain [Sesbania bispinosa]|nr:Ribonuclease H domain [Sesbania bispinosa]